MRLCSMLWGISCISLYFAFRGHSPEWAPPQLEPCSVSLLVCRTQLGGQAFVLRLAAAGRGGDLISLAYHTYQTVTAGVGTQVRPRIYLLPHLEVFLR